jgi:hypothetical protein
MVAVAFLGHGDTFYFLEPTLREAIGDRLEPIATKQSVAFQQSVDYNRLLRSMNLPSVDLCSSQ